ncbi:MAG: hypothetical protein ABI354_00620 [Candidatus Saccharimonadales bacterium]
MTTRSARVEVAEKIQAAGVIAALERMEQNEKMLTKDGYSSNSELHPDNTVSFVDKHIAYLMNHPKVDPDHYMANLRIMLKIRPKKRRF